MIWRWTWRSRAGSTWDGSNGRRNAGHVCEENKLALRDLITASPYARAIYVLEGNRLLCTTLHRPIPVQNLPDYLLGKQDLILASHSPITGQTAILYRQQLGKRTLLAAPVLALLLGLLSFHLGGQGGSPRRELARALAAREFIPYLQPVMSGDGRLCGVEVLMRWRHPEQGMIAPGHFIPLAEECGYIVPMTRQLMEQTQDYLRSVAARLPPGFHVAINVCARHFKDQEIVTECHAFLDALAGHDIRLVLELTEREMLECHEQTLAIFDALDDMGVLVAIDDFGTDHSSLAYLQKFHVDIIKIDRSFIKGIQEEGPSRLIVENILDLARRMEVALVAEGVETAAQVEMVTGFLLRQAPAAGRVQPALSPPGIDGTIEGKR